jgi:hypothetical protein
MKNLLLGLIGFCTSLKDIFLLTMDLGKIERVLFLFNKERTLSKHCLATFRAAFFTSRASSDESV